MATSNVKLAHRSHIAKVKDPSSPDWFKLGDMRFSDKESAKKVADSVVQAMGQGEADTEPSEEEANVICQE